MDFLLLTVLAFACYAVTMLITKSYAMKWVRIGFRDVVGNVFPFFIAQHFTLMFDTDMTSRKPVLCEASELVDGDPPTDGFDFISCPMCVGFWVSIFLCLCAEVFSPLRILAVYGAAFFIHRSERF